MDRHLTRSLCVVARAEQPLHAYMREYFAGRPDVEVILDRRQGPDRRERYGDPGIERRQQPRRVHHIDEDLAMLGFAVVTVR